MQRHTLQTLRTILRALGWTRMRASRTHCAPQSTTIGKKASVMQFVFLFCLCRVRSRAVIVA
jgi:hypothetical protein